MVQAMRCNHSRPCYIGFNYMHDVRCAVLLCYYTVLLLLLLLALQTLYHALPHMLLLLNDIATQDCIHACAAHLVTCAL